MKKSAAFISLFLSLTIIFNSVSAVALSTDGNKKANALTVDTIHGIIAGETLRINVFSDETPLDNYTLTSSDPEVISCSPNGYITGKKAGSSADITYTSKDGTKKTFTIYCVRAIYPRKKCNTTHAMADIYSSPESKKLLSVHINLSPIFNVFAIAFRLLATLGFRYSLNKLAFFSIGDFEVCGQYGNYAYIRFKGRPTSDGFIKYTSLNTEIEQFLYISDYEHTIKSQNDTVYLTADYSGKVNWKVEDDDADGKTDYENSIIKFDPKTGKITAKKGGTTSIRASANGMWQTCEIISIYEWPQEWKVKAHQGIKLYSKPDVVNPNDEIYEGDTFWVVGDLGGSSSWCYVNHGSQSHPEYSYAKIEDFSTKGTISQYNELGWSWPVKDVKNGVIQTKKAKYIKSPYGWRDTRPKNHQGIDITTGKAGEIAGYDIVSAFDGTVIFCGDTYGYDWGYCVAVRSNDVDPVSGMQFVAVYMHLMDVPDVYEGKKVIAGETVLGQVGNTTTPGNDMGYHLHFEFNNQTSSIGVTSDGSQTTGYGRKSFDYLVNPIFLYMDEYQAGEITYNKKSESEKIYFKTFWYGNGKELKDVY